MKQIFRLAGILFLLSICLIGCSSIQSSETKNKPIEEKQEVITEEADAASEPIESMELETPTEISENTDVSTDELKQEDKQKVIATTPANKVTTDSTSAVNKELDEKKQAPSETTKTESKTPTSGKEAKTKKDPEPKETQSTDSKKPVQTKTEPLSTVTITITGHKDIGIILPSTKVEIKDGDTVLDVLLQVAKKKKIVVEYSGAGALAYIEGIDHLYEFDYGPKSGWNFKINGTTISKSSGIVKVNKDDMIEWVYREDYLEEKE
jgi:hypothetical protein